MTCSTSSQLKSGSMFRAGCLWLLSMVATVLLSSGSVASADDHAEHADSVLHVSAAGEVAGAHGAAHGAAGHHAEYSLWSDLPFWSLISFIGFVAAIKVLGLWDLLVDSMSAREKAEHEAIALAEASLTEGKGALRSAMGRMEALDERIREIMAEASRDAQSTRDDIIAFAQREAQGAVDRAGHEIERVRDQALNEIFENVASQVADVTEQRLRSGLNPEDHHRLIGSVLEGLAIR